MIASKGNTGSRGSRGRGGGVPPLPLVSLGAAGDRFLSTSKPPEPRIPPSVRAESTGTGWPGSPPRGALGPGSVTGGPEQD